MTGTAFEAYRAGRSSATCSVSSTGVAGASAWGRAGASGRCGRSGQGGGSGARRAGAKASVEEGTARRLRRGLRRIHGHIDDAIERLLGKYCRGVGENSILAVTAGEGSGGTPF